MTEKEKWLSCTDLQKYRIMKKHYKQTNKKIAEITGNTKESVEVIGISQDFPRLLKLAVHNFAVERGYVNEVS